MTYQEMLTCSTEQLKALPCECVSCDDCRGSGNVRVDDWSLPDGWDLEPCFTCHGAGIVEVCDRCRLLEETEADEVGL
jgi:DnaJ-class molecular chaperone